MVSSAATYILRANVGVPQALVGTGDIDGGGNELNNVITGNGGNNILVGRTATTR